MYLIIRHYVISIGNASFWDSLLGWGMGRTWQRSPITGADSGFCVRWVQNFARAKFGFLINYS